MKVHPDVFHCILKFINELIKDRTNEKTLLALTVISLGIMVGCVENNSRKITSLSGEGWRFTKDASCNLDASAVQFDDSKWQNVEIPHDWAIYGPFNIEHGGGSGALPWRGAGWYRKTVNLSAGQIAGIKAGGALWFEFDGVMASPKVYVNGKLAGSWDYGYMSFRVDAGAFVKEGDNVIAVRADTRDHHSRWYPGAGIYRNVRMVMVPAVHVVPGTEFITTSRIGKDDAEVCVRFTVTNRLDRTASVSVAASVGETCLKRDCVKEIAAKSAQDFTFEVPVAKRKLWDIGAPNLYTAQLHVAADGRNDIVPVRFGIREFKFDPKDGFYLNGKRVQLYGVNLHSDMGPLGMAFNRSVMKRQLRIMMDMGVNAIRTSHNAPDPQLLDLCDELGLFVWDECFDKWNGTAGRRKEQNLEDYISRNLREFIRRDRNLRVFLCGPSAMKFRRCAMKRAAKSRMRTV